MYNINDFINYRVLVIGDIILDRYVFGNAYRISPEAPVPILNVDIVQNKLGGAANVALNCKALGTEVNIISVLGNDVNSKIINNLLHEFKIISSEIVLSSNRKTTTKTRFLSSNQQLLRIDEEDIFNISEDEQTQILNSVKYNIENWKPNVIIFEDYDKGVLNETLITSIIKIAKENKVITCADPKNKNFNYYNYIDLFKPNLKEAINSLGIGFTDINTKTLDEINLQLREKLIIENLIITLSENGIYYNNSYISDIIPAHIREISDVSGAGDTVISVLAIFYIHTKNIELSTKVANLAGGLVCESVGTTVINPNILFNLIN
jgi:rfaE bifunctional protein kinase chain/domain